MSNQEPNRWKGFILGLAGGAAGTFAMGYYWQALVAMMGSDPRKAKSTAGPQTLDDISLIGKHYEPGEGSTAAIGRILYQTASGKEPKKETKATLSTLVHWGYGSLIGGIYGAARGGEAGLVDPAGGAAYGTGVWLFGSEMGVPMLGLAPGPTTQPAPSHAYALGAHWVYGIVVAAVTQLLYKLL
ncbi:MAG: hypothetical protein ACR2M0_07245 [Chloroflexia bacterium]